MSEKRAAGDILTIAGVALVVYPFSTMLHEGLGHAGACWLTGGKIISVSTVAMDCAVDNRLVIAGGTILNFVAAALFFLLLRATSPKAVIWKYFFWLAMSVNLLTATGYFLFSGIGGFGDWAMFIKGLGPEWVDRIVLTLVGAVAYLMAVRFCLLEMRPLIGSGKDSRRERAKTLAHTAYFAGGILACVAGSLNPQGFVLVALSAAAATFGGTSGLIWGTEWLRGARIPARRDEDPPSIRRSWGWIAAAAITATVFIGVAGPGLKFA